MLLLILNKSYSCYFFDGSFSDTEIDVAYSDLRFTFATFELKLFTTKQQVSSV